MKIGFFRFFLFTAIIVGLSVAVFPFKRNMVFLYIESGEVKQATSVLKELLAENPDDFRILMAGATLAIYEGDPDNAIKMIRHALKQKPRNLRALHRLAQYMEWNVRPRSAMAVYEKIIEIDPKDRKALNKVINFSRYFYLPEVESQALAQLILLPPSKRAKPHNIYQQALAPDLRSLAKRRQKDGYDPLPDLLMQRLYILGELYKGELVEGPPPDLDQYVIYALERFIISDSTKEGQDFAARMDREAKTGLKYQLTLATVMRWDGLAKEAVAYLGELEKKYPTNEQVLLAITQAGRDANDLLTVEHAFERLVDLQPDNQDYASNLSDVYMENEKYDKAYGMLKKLVDLGKNLAGLLKKLIIVALYSGDQDMLRSASHEAEQVDLDDPALLQSRAEVYEALDEPAKALPLYLRLAEKEHKLEYAENALRIAVQTNEVKNVQLVADAGRNIDPQNADFWEQVADAYLGVDHPELAFKEFRTVAMLRKTQDVVLRMLEIAGFSGRETIVAEATREASLLQPESTEVAAQSGEIYLWQEKPRKAYPFFLRAAELSKGNKKRVDRMIEVASFVNDNVFFQKAINEAVRLRPNDAMLRRTAAQLLIAQGNSEEAIKNLQVYLKQNPKDEDARKQLAYLLLWTGQGNIGGDQMQLLSKSRMQDPKFLQEWARYTENAGLDEQAFLLYQRLLTMFPDSREYRESVIRLAGYTNRPETVAKLQAEDSDAHSDNFDMAFKAGTAWSQAGNIPKAVRYLERAQAIRPDDMDTLRALATNYGFANRPDHMIASYEKAVANGTKLSSEETLQLAHGYVDTNKGAKAIPLLQDALNQTPLPKEQAVLLATAMLQAGRFAEGTAIYRQLAQEHRSDPIFLADAGDQTMFVGDLQMALEFYKQSLEIQPDNLRALRGSGMIYAQTGNTQQAIRDFRRYNRLRPDDPEVRFQLGELLDVNNQKAQADKEYKKTLRLLRKQAAATNTPQAVN